MKTEALPAVGPALGAERASPTSGGSPSPTLGSRSSGRARKPRNVYVLLARSAHQALPPLPDSSCLVPAVPAVPATRKVSNNKTTTRA